MLTDEQIANMNPAPKLLFDAQWAEAARAIEAASCAERDKRIAELERELVAAKSVPMKYRRMAFNAELQVENANLRKELEAVRKDAERWKKFRVAWAAVGSSKYDAMLGALAGADSESDIDAAIDAARSAHEH